MQAEAQVEAQGKGKRLILCLRCAGFRVKCRPLLRAINVCCNASLSSRCLPEVQIHDGDSLSKNTDFFFCLMTTG